MAMKKEDFDQLMGSIKEAGEIRRGLKKPARVFRYSPAGVKKARAALGQSQDQFARMIGVSVATLRNWEQGRRVPEGPARALLTVAAKNPQAVADALKTGA
jgi:putative transcriptional regulator